MTGRVRSEWRMRAKVAARDRGVCKGCGGDTRKVLRTLVRRTGSVQKAFEALQEAGVLGGQHQLWEMDHVVPLSKGGAHELANLQTLCVSCHQEKTRREARG